VDLALEPSEPVGELTIHLSLAAFGESPRGEHHEVEPSTVVPRSPSSKALPHQSPGTVAQDRASDFPAHGEAQSVVPVTVLGRHQEKERPGQAHSFFERSPKFGAVPEPHPRWKRRLAAHRESGSDALSALLPAPLEHEPAAFRAHSHQETVGLLSPTIVGLERPLHDRWASSPQSRSASQACSRGTKL
jgi:hypothetical protein